MQRACGLPAVDGERAEWPTMEDMSGVLRLRYGVLEDISRALGQAARGL